MIHLIDEINSFILILVFITALAMAKQQHLADNIKTYAFQSFCIFILTLVQFEEHSSIHFLITAIMIFLVKVCFFPALLSYTLHKLNIRDHFENIINVQAIFIVIALLTGFCFFVIPSSTYNFLPLAFAMSFIGILLMSNRTKTISQILGFLVIENAITVAILFGHHEFSLVIEFALALDLLIGIMIMGILSDKIRGGLDHIDVTKLKYLREE